MKVITMQDLGMENKVNLCDSCHKEQSKCQPKFLIYGAGRVNDNIAACDIYSPYYTSNYEEKEKCNDYVN